MKLIFWGTRGSIATPGKETVRYGGNTPCTELRLANDELIILDAGTGIKNLGEQLCQNGKPVRAHVLISHPHWDHIQGFPFFRPAFIAGNEFTIYGGENERVSVRNMLTDQMNKIYFPLAMNDLQARMRFQAIDEGTFAIGGCTVTAMLVNHPSFAFGYRITENGKSVVYISDNEPFDPALARKFRNVEQRIIDAYERSTGDPNQRLYDFVSGADLLIHDATYTPEEYHDRNGWGHSHYLFTLKVAAEGNVKKLVLFHHDPSHSDADMDAIVARCGMEHRRCRYTFELLTAMEGMEIIV